MPAKAASPTQRPSSLPLPPANASWLTVPEAAAVLRCSVKTVRRLLERRELSYHKVGGRVLIHRPDLHAYIAAGRVEAVDAWDL